MRRGQRRLIASGEAASAASDDKTTVLACCLSVYRHDRQGCKRRVRPATLDRCCYHVLLADGAPFDPGTPPLRPEVVRFLHRNTALISRVHRVPSPGGDHSVGQMLMSKKPAQHHKQVAEHLKHAAFHHEEAAKHHETGRHETAAHHAHLAMGHIIHAKSHAEEAVKAHVAEHNRHGTEQRRASA